MQKTNDPATVIHIHNLIRLRFFLKIKSNTAQTTQMRFVSPCLYMCYREVGDESGGEGKRTNVDLSLKKSALIDVGLYRDSCGAVFILNITGPVGDC